MAPFVGNSATRQTLRDMYPTDPQTRDGLEAQQRALLREQQDQLKELGGPRMSYILTWLGPTHTNHSAKFGLRYPCFDPVFHFQFCFQWEKLSSKMNASFPFCE